MKRNSILILAIALTYLWAANAQCDIMVFSDDFSTDTTSNYTWFEEGNGGDDNPLNNYAYDTINEYVTITTANNNNIYMGISLESSLSTPLQSGYFEFSFMPWQTYPTDGLVEMRLYGIGGVSDMYKWHFAHNSALPYAGDVEQYRARLEKWIDGTPIIQEIFIPSPDHYDLGQWHTLSMSFSPTTLTGYLDGQLIISVSDPTFTPITVRSFELVFMQQDQYIDDIFITPIPSPVILGSIGLSLVGWKLRKRKEL